MDLFSILSTNYSSGQPPDGVNITETSVGSSFFETDRVEAITYLLLCGGAMLSGTIGNTLVIGAVLHNKNLRTVGNAFIVNLAIADLCVTGFVDPFTFIGIVKGGMWFDNKFVLCEIVASVCLTSCFCSLLTIGAIGFNRYIHICHNQQYRRIYTLRNTLLMCLGLWIVSFAAEFPNFFGWGDHVFDKKTLSCIWDRTADLSYTIFFSGGGVLFPVVLISICYYRIFAHVRAAKRRIQAVTETTAGAKDKRESVKLAKTLFLIFVVFAACWMPYAIIVVADVNDTFPSSVHTYSVLIAHTNASLNCIMYGVTNMHFRRAYASLLGIDRCAWYKRRHQAQENAEGHSNATDVTAINQARKNGIRAVDEDKM